MTTTLAVTKKQLLETAKKKGIKVSSTMKKEEVATLVNQAKPAAKVGKDQEGEY